MICDNIIYIGAPFEVGVRNKKEAVRMTQLQEVKNEGFDNSFNLLYLYICH